MSFVVFDCSLIANTFEASETRFLTGENPISETTNISIKDANELFLGAGESITFPQGYLEHSVTVNNSSSSIKLHNALYSGTQERQSESLFSISVSVSSSENQWGRDSNNANKTINIPVTTTIDGKDAVLSQISVSCNASTSSPRSEPQKSASCTHTLSSDLGEVIGSGVSKTYDFIGSGVKVKEYFTLTCSGDVYVYANGFNPDWSVVTSASASASYSATYVLLD